MSTAIVPPEVKIAAKRAFVRTVYQGYAGAIPAGGISAAALIGLTQDPNLLVIGLTVLAWLLSPLLGGLVAYLNISSKGIPVEYSDAADIVP